MRIIGLILLCSASIHAASRAWPEMDDTKSKECFRARELRQKGTWLYNSRDFISQNSEVPLHKYRSFYKDDACASMVFGTASFDGKFQDVFAPSRSQTKELIEILQSTVQTHIAEKMRMQSMNTSVIGLYPMPQTVFGVAWPTSYTKIPCLRADEVCNKLAECYLEQEDDVLVVSGVLMPQYCVVFSDVFDVGRTEFQLAANFLDVSLSTKAEDQRAKMHVLFAAVYLQNGREEDVTVRLDGQDYSIGVVKFRGNMWDRLMIHAKLHVMDAYLSKTVKSAWYKSKTVQSALYKSVVSWVSSPQTEKERILSLKAGDRGDALREIFDKDSGLEEMAYDRYMAHIEPRCIFAISVNDFVEKKWIDQESADDMWIAMPTVSLSAEKGLDLEPPLRHLFNKADIKHFLEPILLLQPDQIVLDGPAGHAAILKERTGFIRRHEANLLILQKNEDGHYYATEDWWRFCEIQKEWQSGETIGVVLLDPYVKTGCGPTRSTHPHLLEDVRKCMEKGLRSRGYNVRFFHLSQNGDFCDYLLDDSAPQSYPKAQAKHPVCWKFLDNTVHVVWNGDSFLRSSGVYNGIRYNA